MHEQGGSASKQRDKLISLVAFLATLSLHFIISISLESSTNKVKTMVRRQGTRFGMTTNHSIRRSNMAATASNQDVNQFVVVKTMSIGDQCTAKGKKRILSEFSQQINDGDLAINSDDIGQTQSPILYSLNKHKRWELPEMLKENILEEENHTESKFQLSLSERHIGAGTGTSIRSGDCIGVHQSKSTHAQRLPKQSYAFELDLKGSAMQQIGRKRGRKTRRGQVEVEASDEDVVNQEDILPEIHYEVCYPRPRNKYQYCGKANRGHSDTVAVKSGKKSSKKAQISWLDHRYGNLEDDFEIYDDDVASSEPWYEEDVYGTEVAEDEISLFESSMAAQDGCKVDTSGISLGDVLVTLLIDAVCAETTHNKPAPKRKRHNSKTNSVSSLENSDNDTKVHIVFIDPKDAEKFQPREDEPDVPKQVRRKTRNRRRNNRHQIQPPEPVPETAPLPAEHFDGLQIIRKVSINSLKSSNLCSTFADCYYEGQCQPRRFVINLKPTVEEYLTANGHERTAKTMMESPHQILLLFEPFGCVEGVIGSDTPAYKQIRLKQAGFPQDFTERMRQRLNCSNNCWCSTVSYPWRAIKMEPEPSTEVTEHTDQCSTSVWAVKQLVQLFQKGIGEVPPESFYRSDGAISWIAKHPTVTLETVQSMSQIEWQSCTPDAIIQNVHHDAIVPSNSAVDGKPTNCAICYESLMASVHSMDATALTVCGHWFCNDCWRQHIRSRVKQGDINIICPEFNCDTPVDKVILLAYLTPKEFCTQTIHTRNTTLNSQPEWKWCPNTACGRLVKAANKAGSSTNDGASVTINCECGLLWCSSCKGEGHWPATCEQAAAYWKLIKKNGSVRWKMFSPVGNITHVRVKKCPFCRNLIEKQDGCNYMMCICSRAFCWDCLQDYDKHDYSVCRNNMKKLQKVSITEDKPVVMSMLGIALQHRERRTRFAVMRRRKAAEILAKKAFLIRQNKLDQSTLTLRDDDTRSVASSSRDEDTSSVASSSSSQLSVSFIKKLPLTWIQDNESSWQLLQDLLETAANVAKFCSEMEFCLEYVEVLLNDPNTELKSPDTLVQLKDRLIFIADQLHMILHGELKVNADSAMDRVTILMHAGKKCLKWIAANVPVVLSSQDDEE